MAKYTAAPDPRKKGFNQKRNMHRKADADKKKLVAFLMKKNLAY